MSTCISDETQNRSKQSLLARDTCWDTLCWQQMSEAKEVVTLQHVSIREPRKQCGGAKTCSMVERKALVPLCAHMDLQQCTGLRFFQSR